MCKRIELWCFRRRENRIQGVGNNDVLSSETGNATRKDLACTTFQANGLVWGLRDYLVLYKS